MGKKDPGGSRKPAPNFRLTDLAGKPLELVSYRGKVVILDFWATWCPPCRAEIPHFKSLIATYKSKGFEMIGIAVGEEEGAVKSFAQANGIPYSLAKGIRSYFPDDIVCAVYIRMDRSAIPRPK